jgi:molybdate transport system substrate-binding protein
VNFISAGAAQGLVNAVAKAAGIDVAGSFGAVGAMLEKFDAGEACDVVILSHAQIAGLAERGKVVAGTCVDLGSVPTAIAVRADQPAVDVSTEGALREALLAADAIHFPDPLKSTAGIHFAKVIQQLGIRTEVAARLKTFPNGMTAMRALAEAPGNPIGCTQTTEIFATPGVKLVAPLPKGFDLETVYTAAVSASARDPDEAAAFVERLSSDASRKTRIDAGFRGFLIRRARSTDAAAIRNVVHDVLAEYGLTLEPTGMDNDLADIHAAYFERGGLFEVAVDSDGRVVGTCGVYVVDEKVCELRKMYLLKEARGRGIGGRFLRRAIAFARGGGYHRMELETNSILKEAIALYSGAGFQPVKHDRLASRCNQAFALEL